MAAKWQALLPLAVVWVAWVTVSRGDVGANLHPGDAEPAVTPLRENQIPSGLSLHHWARLGEGARVRAEPEADAEGEQAKDQAANSTTESAGDKQDSAKPEEDPNLPDSTKAALLRLKEYKRVVEANQKTMQMHIQTSKRVLEEMQKRVSAAIGSNNCSALTHTKSTVDTLLGELDAQLFATKKNETDTEENVENEVETEKAQSVRKIKQIQTMDPLKHALMQQGLETENRWFENFWAIRGEDLCAKMTKSTHSEVEREIALKRVAEVSKLQKQIGVEAAKLDRKVADDTDKEVLLAKAQLKVLQNQSALEITKNMNNTELVAKGGEDKSDQESTVAVEKALVAEQLLQKAKKQASGIKAKALATEAKAEQSKAKAEVEIKQAQAEGAQAEKQKREARNEQEDAVKRTQKAEDTEQQVQEQAKAAAKEEVKEAKREAEKEKEKAEQAKKEVEEEKKEAEKEKEKAKQAKAEVEEEKKEVEKATETAKQAKKEVEEEKKEADKEKEKAKQAKKEVEEEKKEADKEKEKAKQAKKEVEKGKKEVEKEKKEVEKEKNDNDKKAATKEVKKAKKEVEKEKKEVEKEKKEVEKEKNDNDKKAAKKVQKKTKSKEEQRPKEERREGEAEKKEPISASKVSKQGSLAKKIGKISQVEKVMPSQTFLKEKIRQGFN